MTKLFTFAFAAAGLFALSATASATFLNFDDGTASNTVGSFYSAQGVTFTNARWNTNLGLAGSSGNLALIHNTVGFHPVAANPIGALFSTEVSSVTLRGIDVGDNGYWLKAYDSSNSVVDSQLVFGTGLGVGQFFDLTVNGPIARVEFFQDHVTTHDDGSSDGILFEDMSFSPVPEPASMIALGAGALALLRRRRK